MMSNQHTPGPWLYGAAYGNNSVLIEAAQGVNVATVINHTFSGIEKGHPVYTWNDEGDANARLIAAAPELLTALERLVGQCDRLRIKGQPMSDAEKFAAIAIAKATRNIDSVLDAYEQTEKTSACMEFPS